MKRKSEKSNNTLTTKQKIKLIKKKAKRKHKRIDQYKKERGLSKANIELWYIDYLKVDEIRGNIVDSIIIPVRDIEDEIIGYDIRSLQKENDYRYSKILDEERTHLYNVKNPYISKKVYLTEGVFDCKTLEMFSKNSVTAMRAKVPNTVLHFMAVLYNHIVVVFDNDDSGKSGAKQVKKFYKRYYPDIKVEVVKLPKKYKDVNEFYNNQKKKFKEWLEGK